MKKYIVVLIFLFLLNYCNSNKSVFTEVNSDALLIDYPDSPAVVTERTVEDFILKNNSGFNESEVISTSANSTNFNYATIVNSKLKLKINLYDLSMISPENLFHLDAAAISKFQDKKSKKNISVILKDAESKKIIRIANSDAEGNLEINTNLPTHLKNLLITVEKSKYHRRTFQVDNILDFTSIEKELSLVQTSVSTIENDLRDSDNDNVPDVYDSFPADPTRAFQVNSPIDGSFTIAFEDNFPHLGDGDYNDFIATYRIKEIYNNNNQLVQIDGEVKAIARVAGYDHRFGMKIGFSGQQAKQQVHYLDYRDNLVSSVISEVTDKTNIILFNNTKKAFTRLNGGSGVDNGYEDQPISNGHSTIFSITFANPVDRASVENLPFDPYLYVHNTGYDIHLLGKPKLENSKNPVGVEGFRDSNGFPRALLVPNDWKYPKEHTHIEVAYPDFKKWRESIGLESSDWYGRFLSEKVLTPLDFNILVKTLVTPASGGILEIPGVIKVEIPPGAVTENIVFRIEKSLNDIVSEKEYEYYPFEFYKIQPSFQFNKLFKISLNYNPIYSGADLRLGTYNQETDILEILPTTFDENQKILFSESDHFSFFGSLKKLIVATGFFLKAWSFALVNDGDPDYDNIPNTACSIPHAGALAADALYSVDLYKAAREFHSSCIIHDNCYDYGKKSYNLDRRACDDQMRFNNEDVCRKSTTWNFKECVHARDLMYEELLDKGGRNYDRAQAKNGHICQDYHYFLGHGGIKASIGPYLTGRYNIDLGNYGYVYRSWQYNTNYSPGSDIPVYFNFTQDCLENVYNRYIFSGTAPGDVNLKLNDYLLTPAHRANSSYGINGFGFSIKKNSNYSFSVTNILNYPDFERNFEISHQLGIINQNNTNVSVIPYFLNKFQAKLLGLIPNEKIKISFETPIGNLVEIKEININGLFTFDSKVRFPNSAKINIVESSSSTSCVISNDSWLIYNPNDLGFQIPEIKCNSINLSGKIVTNGTNVCHLKSGQVLCWGGSLTGNGTPLGSMVPYEVFPVGSQVTDLISFTNGSSICALKNGGAYCWGYNLGFWDSSISNPSYSPVPTFPESSGISGITKDCIIQNSGLKCGYTNNNLFPTYVLETDGAGVTDLAGYSPYSGGTLCYIKNTGLFCFGGNLAGEVGNGSLTAVVNTPQQIFPEGFGIKKVMTGSSGTCAMTISKNLYCWGPNVQGMVGVGGNVSDIYRTPQKITILDGKVEDFHKVQSSVGGDNYICAVVNKGLYCWGGLPAQVQCPVESSLKVVTSPFEYIPENSDITGISIGALNKNICTIYKNSPICWDRTDGSPFCRRISVAPGWEKVLP